MTFAEDAWSARIALAARALYASVRGWLEADHRQLYGDEPVTGAGQRNELVPAEGAGTSSFPLPGR
jgi:hypothetical protein